jgi:murein DD-endopeptidase MepM/ murein hydrolase activator NlpD
MLLLGKKFIRNSISFMLSGIIFLGYVFVPVVEAAGVEDRKNSKSVLQSKKKELAKELQAASAEVKTEAKNKNNIDKQIQLIQSQIDISNNYINNLENEIADIQKQIADLKEDMKKKITLLKKSVASVYVAGDTSTLDIVLGAKDFEDFLDKADIVRSVSKTIKKLIDDLENDLLSIEKKEKEITENKKEQEEEKVSLEKSRSDLQDLFDKSEQALSELQTSEQQVKNEIDQNDAAIKAIDAQICKYYEEQKRKAEEEARKRASEGKPVVQDKPVCKGGFVWPVPGYYKVTSGFNDTESRARMHGAIDIAGRGIYGAPVVAAAAGTVILANTDGRGGGYGNYVVVDHGNGLSTVYGHLSSVAVQVGKKVSAGQMLGNAGNTGFSTGPHVHFECRKRGVRTDPHEFVSY